MNEKLIFLVRLQTELVEQPLYLSRGTKRIPRVPLGFVDKVQHTWFGGVTGTLSGLQVKFK